MKTAGFFLAVVRHSPKRHMHLLARRDGSTRSLFLNWEAVQAGRPTLVSDQPI